MTYRLGAERGLQPRWEVRGDSANFTRAPGRTMRWVAQAVIALPYVPTASPPPTSRHASVRSANRPRANTALLAQLPTLEGDLLRALTRTTRNLPSQMVGSPRCLRFGGPRVEAAVARELLRAVEPMAIEAALEAERMLCFCSSPSRWRATILGTIRWLQRGRRVWW
jgi:hypothetical protein